MVHEFSIENLNLIGQTLGVEAKLNGNVYRFELQDEDKTRKLALEIIPDLIIDGRPTNLVSVYSHNTFLQLHNCIGFISSDILNQVTFFGKTDNTTSGLIIEKEAGCSYYANVDDAILKGDFTKLPTELMMCSVALSLTDSIDFEGFSFE
jgi:hypothetical protein